MTRARFRLLTIALFASGLFGCSASSEGPVLRWPLAGAGDGPTVADWRIAETNPSRGLARWEIVNDTTAPEGANVLALTASENFGQTFNLAIAEGTRFGDFDLVVDVKAVSGSEDQGGGPIWRCRDANNYYICRFNPLESNYRVYRVKDGRRKQLASTRIETQPDRWYRVRVTMVGNRIRCYLDGQLHLEVCDDTFPDPGQVGVWTKADAVTSFASFAVRPPPESDEG